MFKESHITRPAIFKRNGLISLLISLALMATACGGTVSNLTPTPTTVMGFVPEQGSPPTGQPSEVSTPNGEPGQTATPDTLLIIGAMQYNKVNVCSLATDAQVEAVLGQTITEKTPGEDADSVSGGTLYFCTYLGSGLAVVLSWVETGTPAAAEQALKDELAQMQADEPSAIVTSVTGMGDKAFWTVTTHAASFVVVKGGRVLSVALGGNIGDPDAHKAALKTLAESIAAGM
jgi:hypothetical protein